MAHAINADVLDGIRELQDADSPDLLATLVKMFLASLPERTSAMTTAVAQSDAVTVREQAHSLKSSAGNLGAMALSSLCGKLEELGKTRELREAPAVLEQLKQEAARVRGELESIPEMAAPRKSA